MKKLLTLAAALFGAINAYSLNLTFPVSGLMTVSPRPQPVSTEWNDNWILEASAFEYHHGIARVAAMLSEISYVDVAENPNENEVKLSYKALGIKENAMEFHYKIDYSTPVLGDNQAAFSFASKQISGPSGNKTLIFVVIRGTPLNANEWISNLAISDSTRADTIMHEGFYRTMVQVQNALVYYMLKQKIDPDEACFLITGHSRGAAVANLLGASLVDQSIFNSEKMFVYTFAAPNVTQADDVNNYKYNFIWNIVNGEDIVPTVPPCRNNWKFKKYGHIITLPNRWNTDKELYDKSYVPRINKYYNILLERDYCPFKNGTFIQSGIARFLTSFYKDVHSYYSGTFNLRNRGEKMMWQIFPKATEKTTAVVNEQNENQTENAQNESDGIFNRLAERLNESTDGGVDYVKNAFVDMHACELYLSCMLALNENEIRSTLGSTQIILDGYYECAIFDFDGNLLAQVLDGVIQYKNIKVPIAAMPLLGKKTVIGFPANENFKVLIYKPSLIPTIIRATVEQYDVAGYLVHTSEKQNLYPREGIGLSFKAGQVLLEDEQITAKKIHGLELKKQVQEAGLELNKKFTIQPELNIDIDQHIGLGVHFGTKNIYGSILTHQPLSNFGDIFELSPGIGHQHPLYGNLMLDTELYTRFIYIFEDIEDKGLNLVPSLRLSLSFKPVHRFQIFVAGVFDLNINDFNDGAFDQEIRKQRIGSINFGDSVHLVPSIRFGLKF
ncbi:MAG: lipase family protein [Treponema sp.]|nr:lipase family protein [Candidatus Treponema equifaecale]